MAAEAFGIDADAFNLRRSGAAAPMEPGIDAAALHRRELRRIQALSKPIDGVLARGLLLLAYVLNTPDCFWKPSASS